MRSSLIRFNLRAVARIVSAHRPPMRSEHSPLGCLSCEVGPCLARPDPSPAEARHEWDMPNLTRLDLGPYRADPREAQAQPVRLFIMPGQPMARWDYDSPSHFNNKKGKKTCKK